MIHSSVHEEHWLGLRHLHVRWLRYLVPLLVIGLAVHVLLPKIADFKKSWEVLRQMSLALLGLAVLFQIGRYVASGFMLQSLVQLAGGKLKLWRSISIGLASTSVGLVAAGAVGSMVALYNWLLPTGVDKQGAGLTAVLKTVFTDGLIFVLSVISLIYLLLAHDLTGVQIAGYTAVLLLLLVVGGGLIWGIAHPDVLQKQLNQMLAVWAKLRRKPVDAQTADHLVRQSVAIADVLRAGGWQRPLLGATLRTVFDVLTLYALFVAAKHPVGVGVLLVGYGLPLLLGKMSFLPGGVGVVEASMTAVYTSFGVSTEVSVVVILAYRFISFWLPILFGVPLAVYLQRETAVPTAH